MNLGNNIAELRKKRSLTQEQLAEMCDVSRQAVTKWEAGISEPAIEKLVKISEVFQVSLDELVTGKKVAFYEKENNVSGEIDFKDIAFCIADYKECFSMHYFTDYLMLEANILNNLILLLEVMRSKYVGADDKVYEKYLLKNTTKEERKKHAVLLDQCEPINKYINGECEIDEALDMAAEEISNECSQILEIEINKKKDSKEAKLYKRIVGILYRIKDLNIYNDKIKEVKAVELEQAIEQLHLEIQEYGDDAPLGRFWIFMEQEVNSIYKNNENEKADKFGEMVRALKNFVWSQIPVQEEQARRKKRDEKLQKLVNELKVTHYETENRN